MSSLSTASVAYQQQLEMRRAISLRASSRDEQLDEDLREQLDEDLVKARRELEIAWLEEIGTSLMQRAWRRVLNRWLERP